MAEKYDDISPNYALSLNGFPCFSLLAALFLDLFSGSLGLVTAIDNYEVYALTWDDVFKSFEIRHSFLLDKLKVDQEAIAEELTAKSDSSDNREVANNIKDSICSALSAST